MTSVSSLINHSKERIRFAVFTFFIAQGLCFASWASRLPDIKANFGISDFSHFGYLLTLIPIGKFVAIPLVGFLLPRFKSKITAQISLIGFIITLFLVGFTAEVTNGGLFLLGILLFLFGMFWNMTDISLNTQAIEVERMYGKPIIAMFHASWSIAACVGALVGFVMINLNIEPFYHFTIMTAITLIFIVSNRKYLQEPDDIEKKQDNIIHPEIKSKRFKLPELILIQLGIIWLLALIVENTMFEWSDIYFQSVIKAPKALQIGFLVFMIMMSVGRMLTNAAYRIWSKSRVLEIAGTLIFIGFFTSALLINYVDGLTAKVIVNSIGFMLIGLGISCIVPTLYSIVGEKATIPVGTALTIMSSISFVGPLIAPSLVGFVSKYWSMEYAYMLIGLFGAFIVLIVMCSKTLRK